MLPIVPLAILALALVLGSAIVRLVPEVLRPAWFRSIKERQDAGAFARLASVYPEYPVFGFLGAALLVILVTYPVLDAVLRTVEYTAPFGFWDFGVFLRAAEASLHGGRIYTPAESGGYHGSYLYPPVFLLLFRPLLGLSFDMAVFTWMVVTMLFLWASLQVLIRGLGLHLRLWERGVLLLAVLGYHPLFFSIKQGQVSAFMAGCVTFAGAALVYGLQNREHGFGDGRTWASGGRTGRALRLASGAITTIPAAMKLPYAPIGAHLLQNRERFAGAVAMGIGLVVLSFGLFGVEVHRTYLDVLMWGKGGSSRHPSLWMPAYYQPLYVLGEPRTLVRGLLAGVVALLALATSRSEADLETFALGVAAMPLIAPRADLYYLSALLPVVVILVAIELRRGGHPALPVLALGFLHFQSSGTRLFADILVPIAPYHDLYFTLSPALQPGLWGNAILIGVAGYRVTEYLNVGAIVEGLRTRWQERGGETVENRS
ncbi:MAG: glycosyltransferase family 87 protein [Halodesulfurarchaeum sp.]